MIRVEERWPVPSWIVRAASVAASAGCLLLIWWIWTVTSSARAGMCAVANGSPFTTFPYPSQAFVFTAIGGYVAGHLSSRYVTAVRPELLGDLGRAKFERIGPVLVVKVLATGLLLIATILNVYEARAFISGHWPITYYVWCATAASPALGLAGAAAISFLVGRWLWVAS